MGDVLAVVKQWPQSVAFSLSIVVPDDDRPDEGILADLAPLGLVPGHPSRFVVALGAYGRRALLVGSFQVADNDAGQLPGTSVVALQWSGNGPSDMREGFGLWTTSLGNPAVFCEDGLPFTIDLSGELVHRSRPRRPLN